MITNVLKCPKCGSELNESKCGKCGHTLSRIAENIFTSYEGSIPKLDSEEQIKFREDMMVDNRFSVEMMNFTAKTLKDQKGIFLDVGCGTGFYSSLIQKRLKGGVKFVGLDLNTHFDPKIASDNYMFIQGDFLKHPFKNDSFDAIINYDVIEHVEDDYKFVENTVDLLKKDGIFIIGTPNGDRLPVKWHELIHGKRTFPVNYGNDPLLGYIEHVREYTKKSMTELFSKFSDRIDFEIVPFLLGSRIVKMMIGIPYPGWFFGKYCYYWFAVGKKK